MARISLNSARNQLSGKPWLTGILVIFALGVWTWNAKSLWQQRQPDSTVLTLPEALPELPETERRPALLPPLEKDPFLGAIASPKREEAQPKRQVQSEKKAPPPKPPQGKLLMILKRQGEFAAVIHFRGMDPEVFFEGDRYEDWTVREITLQTVTWFHKPTEKTHVVELP